MTRVVLVGCSVAPETCPSARLCLRWRDAYVGRATYQRAHEVPLGALRCSLFIDLTKTPLGEEMTLERVSERLKWARQALYTLYEEPRTIERQDLLHDALSITDMLRGLEHALVFCCHNGYRFASFSPRRQRGLIRSFAREFKIYLRS